MPKDDDDTAVARAALLHQLSLEHLRAAIANEPPPLPPDHDPELAKLLDKVKPPPKTP